MKLPNGKTFLRSNSARAACSSARPTARAARPIENLGPLTKKRMETIDDETMAAAKDFITRQAQGRQAVLLLVERHADALPHAREDGAPAPGATTSTPTAWSSTTSTSANCSS